MTKFFFKFQSNMAECSIGVFLNDENCSNTSYSRQSNINNFLDFTESERKLLYLRTGCYNIDTVCTYHGKKYLDKFTHLFGNSCCDPFSLHKKVITKALRPISLDLAENNLPFHLIPGKSLCTSCLTKFQHRHEIFDENDDENSDLTYEPPNAAEVSVNEACTSLGISPVRLKRLSSDARPSAIKRKVLKISEVITSKLHNSYNLPFSPYENQRDTQAELCPHYEELIEKLKRRMETAESVQEKVNILSLLPSTYTSSQIQKDFKVTEYLVHKTRDLVKKQGVLPKVESKKPSNILDIDTIKTVETFYQNDDYSRMMPGKTDCKSIRRQDGSKEYVQKRLLLCNLKELYADFKTQFPNIKIGFSKFAELRPKFCILAGGTGTHSVCVCLYH